MTKIETDRVKIEKDCKSVFQFLKDFKNFEQLLPEDRIENYQSDGVKCSFRIKGMADIGMAIENFKEYSEINITSDGKVPFSFKLDVHLKEMDDSTTEAQMIFSGDINPFMQMMVEKPLRNFFNMVIQKLAKIN